MAAQVNEAECIACGSCAEVCPNDAITVDDVAVVDPDLCIDCGLCEEECPVDAITV